MNTRSITIEKQINGPHSMINVCGLENFSIEEMRELQCIIGRFAYNHAMTLQQEIDNLNNNNLFKGHKNAIK